MKYQILSTNRYQTRYSIDFASKELAEVGALRDKYDHRLVDMTWIHFTVMWYLSLTHG